MTRKSLLIIVIIFFFIGAGFLIYQFLQPGETAPVSTTNTGVTNPFGNFFPDSNTPATPAQNIATEQPATIDFTSPINDLRKISAVPVAGSVVFDRTATSSTSTAGTGSTIFRYVERATGHVYEISSTDSVATRISNTTLPRIYEASFLDNKDKVVFRYLDTDDSISTYVATIKSTTTDSGEKATNLEGIFIQKDIFDFSASPDGKNVFVLSRNSNPNSQSVLLGQSMLSSNITNQTTIFNSPLSSWLAEWSNNNSVSIINKPGYDADGILYSLNTKTNTRSKILGPMLGLMAKISPDGKKVFYSRNNGDEIVTGFLNISNGLTKNVSISTLAEKCIWSKDNKNVYCAVPTIPLVGQYPDGWYMGLLSFDDYLVKIDTELETVQTVMALRSKTSEPLDMVDLQFSPREDILMFTNKHDLSLWTLDIRQD